MENNFLSEIERKVCRVCGKEKYPNEMKKCNSKPRKICKKCSSLQESERIKNSPRQQKLKKIWRQRNKDKQNKYMINFFKKHPNYMRNLMRVKRLNKKNEL